MSTWNEFVTKANEIATEKGFPVGVLLAQAALETGRNEASAPANNWFGIKGKGTAGSNNLATKEQGANGLYNTRGNFAAFSKPEDAINAYIHLITQSPQFSQAWKQYQQDKNPFNLVRNVAPTYATDASYAEKVMNTPEFQNWLNSDQAAEYYKNAQSSAPTPTSTLPPPAQGSVQGAMTSRNSSTNNDLNVKGFAGVNKQGIPIIDATGASHTSTAPSLTSQQQQQAQQFASMNVPQRVGHYLQNGVQGMVDTGRAIKNAVIPPAGATDETALQPLANYGASYAGNSGRPQNASYLPQGFTPPTQSKNSYTIQKGDTLWGIAQRLTGNGANWKQLQYSGNPKTLGVGTQIHLPPSFQSQPQPQQTQSPPAPNTSTPSGSAYVPPPPQYSLNRVPPPPPQYGGFGGSVTNSYA